MAQWPESQFPQGWRSGSAHQRSHQRCWWKVKGWYRREKMSIILALKWAVIMRNVVPPPYFPCLSFQEERLSRISQNCFLIGSERGKSWSTYRYTTQDPPLRKGCCHSCRECWQQKAFSSSLSRNYLSCREAPCPVMIWGGSPDAWVVSVEVYSLAQ